MSCMESFINTSRHDAHGESTIGHGVPFAGPHPRGYPPNHDIPQTTKHNIRNSVPGSLCGFFYVPQGYEHSKGYEIGPLSLSKKTRESDHCRCHYKGSTFSSVTKIP